MRDSVKRNFAWSLMPASMLIGMGLALANIPPAEASTPACTFGWSINTTNHRVTLYNEPFDVKADNSFKVVYTDGDGLYSSPARGAYHPKKASGMPFANIVAINGNQYVGWAYYGWRNGHPCKGSGPIITSAG